MKSKMDTANVRLKARRQAEAVNIAFGIAIGALLIALAAMAFADCLAGLFQWN